MNNYCIIMAGGINTCTKWSYAPQETLEYELLHHDEG